MKRKAHPAFLSFKDRILKRDSYRCCYCGFSSIEGMDIVNVDHNFLNNSGSNVLTACSMCTQCFFIDAIGKSDFGGGVLIYLPELTQAQLNGLCHVLFFNIAFGTSYSSQAKDVYRSLKMRVNIIEKVLGKGLSNPSVYGQVLIDSDREDIENIHDNVAQNVRLLPNLKRFSSSLLTWSQDGIDTLYNQS